MYMWVLELAYPMSAVRPIDPAGLWGVRVLASPMGHLNFSPAPIRTPMRVYPSALRVFPAPTDQSGR